jgi:hypothetical protein
VVELDLAEVWLNETVITRVQVPIKEDTAQKLKLEDGEKKKDGEEVSSSPSALDGEETSTQTEEEVK